MLKEKANYQITVEGELNLNLSSRLNGLSVNNISTDSGEKSSILTGEITDQAALMGILNTLFDFGFKVISLSKIDA